MDFEVGHRTSQTDALKKSTKQNGEYDKHDIGRCEVSGTNLMSDEDAGLFQEQLRKRFRNEDNRQRVEMVEIVENLERDTKKLAQEEESLQSQLLREHKQFLRDENESLAKMKDGRKDSQATVRPASTLPTVNLYDISSHRPVSALEFQYVNI